MLFVFFVLRLPVLSHNSLKTTSAKQDLSTKNKTSISMLLHHDRGRYRPVIMLAIGEAWAPRSASLVYMSASPLQGLTVRSSPQHST